jgi:hypothetical protein
MWLGRPRATKLQTISGADGCREDVFYYAPIKGYVLEQDWYANPDTKVLFPLSKSTGHSWCIFCRSAWASGSHAIRTEVVNNFVGHRVHLLVL